MLFINVPDANKLETSNEFWCAMAYAEIKFNAEDYIDDSSTWLQERLDFDKMYCGM